MNKLRWHGDNELGKGLIDLAVNVRAPTPPSWLAEIVTASIGHLGAYPDPGPARVAIAARHGVDEAMVLPTSGGAEVFTLMARGLDTRCAAVVHPQFTEPEAALRAARVPVKRVLLPGPAYALDPDLVPEHADLVVIGNPTNPTGVLHPAETLRGLCRPGRVVLIDEAFSDATPGEPETLITHQMPGLIVARSLTKTWSLAGLRAGYLIGDPALVARLAEQQPHWSVSTPALAAMVATAAPAAVAEAEAAAVQIAAHRAYLIEGLTTAGLRVVGGHHAPFVLVHATAELRETLRTKGFATRRCDTFPGLGPEYLRLAVREPAVTDALLAALGR